jgi:TolB-like protein/DNA-binding winged helix-turn-helix (wHTH) protein/tetratricopeptide (TPR) repeat protein
MSDPAAPMNAAIEFDDIRVEVDAHRLFRAGVEVPVEPKAFAVLAMMLARPGHAFGRDELLDAVWGHRHVTPGVLNRVISLLRRALGDDIEQARYLQTVHGVGYRLVLPETPSAPVASGNADVPPAFAAGLPEVRDAATAPSRRQTDLAPPPALRGRRALAVTAVVAMLALAGVFAWWRPAPLASVATSPATDAPTLAVLPLRPLGDDPREAAFADGLSEEMITLLAQIDGLRVSSRTSSFLPPKPGDSIADIAARLKVNHVLEGSVRQEGENLRIALRLVDVASDRAVWSQTFDRKAVDVFTIQSDIAQAVGSALSLRFGVGGRSVPRLASPGEDPVLYQRYLEARYFKQTPYGGYTSKTSIIDSERELRAMLAEHPDYARAWGGLSVVLWARSLNMLEDRDLWRNKAEEAAREAMRLDPNQPDADAVLAGIACRDGQWEECLLRLERAVRQVPSDTPRRLWYAQRLATAGYLKKAMAQLEIAEAIDPLSPEVAFLQVRLLDTLGRHDEAGRIVKSNPQMSQVTQYFNAVWRRDYAEARRQAEALPPEDRWRASEIAAVEALQDPRRWPAVRALIDVSEPAQQGQPALYNFVRLLVPTPDIPRDIAGLEVVQRDGYSSFNLVLWQVQYRAHRQHPAFADYLRRTGALAYYQRHGWPDRCKPAAQGVVCD